MKQLIWKGLQRTQGVFYAIAESGFSYWVTGDMTSQAVTGSCQDASGQVTVLYSGKSFDEAMSVCEKDFEKVLNSA